MCFGNKQAVCRWGTAVSKCCFVSFPILHLSLDHPPFIQSNPLLGRIPYLAREDGFQISGGEFSQRQSSLWACRVQAGAWKALQSFPSLLLSGKGWRNVQRQLKSEESREKKRLTNSWDPRQFYGYLDKWVLFIDNRGTTSTLNTAPDPPFLPRICIFHAGVT